MLVEWNVRNITLNIQQLSQVIAPILNFIERIFYVFYLRLRNLFNSLILSIPFYLGSNHPPLLTIRNWSDASQILEVPFPKSLADLMRCLCLKTQMSPPLNIYFLGELKHLEAREKIVDDSGLMACLDKIVGWNICDNPILPEILFQFGQSPINTPDKLTKKSSAISSPSHLLSSRSGQTEFNEGVLRRDLNSCMFCDATDNLSAAHLIAYKEIGSPSLNAIFAKCHIGTIQDLANGITLCKMCHDQFDYHFVGVNPETMRVEVSGALLDSKSSEIRDKWNLIHGKTIGAKFTMGHWPSVEAFR